MPELRIIDQALWEKVKARQGAIEAGISGEGVRIEDRRRPRYLFSGLLKCGSCGGGFVKYSHDRLGCATARTKGTCDNLLTIKRPFVEACVLKGLRDHLMNPSVYEIFCEEYTRHVNELRMERSAASRGYRSELDKVVRDQDRLVQAILDGVPGSQVKDRMAQLEVRKAKLEALLAQAHEEPVLLHPNLSQLYRQQVARLVEALNDEFHRTEAVEVIRGLVDRIELTPNDEGGLDVQLYGDLARILSSARRVSANTNAQAMVDRGVDCRWLRGQDLNLRPSGYEPDELPDCSTPRRSGIRGQTTDQDGTVWTSWVGKRVVTGQDQGQGGCGKLRGSRQPGRTRGRPISVICPLSSDV